MPKTCYSDDGKPMANTSVKAPVDLIQFAKLKKINMSEVFRRGLETQCGLYDTPLDKLQNRVAEIDQTIEDLMFERSQVTAKIASMQRESFKMARERADKAILLEKLVSEMIRLSPGITLSSYQLRQQGNFSHFKIQHLAGLSSLVTIDHYKAFFGPFKAEHKDPCEEEIRRFLISVLYNESEINKWGILNELADIEMLSQIESMDAAVAASTA